MNPQRFLATITATALTIIALAACSGSPSATTAATSAPSGTASGTLALYPDAKPLASGSPMATAIDAAKQQLKQQQQGANVTVDAYTIPTGTGFDKIKSFYDQNLTGNGWKVVEMPGQTAAAIPGGGLATWTKGSNEVVTVMVMPDPSGSTGPVLLISQAQK